MALSEFKQGDIIHREGDEMTTLSLITSGEVQSSFFGRECTLEKADVIGLCDLVPRVHSRTYTAITDGTLYRYDIDESSAIDELIQSNADLANVMVNSMCNQTTELLQHTKKLKDDADNAYELLQELYEKYVQLCKTYAYTPKKLFEASELAPVPNSVQIENWVHDYYSEIKTLDPKVSKLFFFGHPGISLGFVRTGAERNVSIKIACNDYFEYNKSISGLLLSDSGHDLFSIISDLHINSVHIKGADEAVEALIEPLTWFLSEMSGIDQERFQSRLDAYGDHLTERQVSSEKTDAPQTAGAGVTQNLQDSLSVILEYSGCPEEMCNTFSRAVVDYTALKDRRSSDDEVYDLRRTLTSNFYEIYKQVILKTIGDPAVPTIVKMFLNFGYVDPMLAGPENAAYMYSIADSVKGDPENNIFTASEWLMAIYNGQREPSLSEFEMEYPAYVKELKQSQNFDAKEEARLLSDPEAKLRFEMENVFPVVNRVTYGNPTVFVPVFADHNIVRNIEDTFVQAEQLKKYLDEIRSIDFSAFFRETAYTNPKLGVPNEVVNVEVMPNIILMPNLGLRGSMWQEIEGRLRTTPARIFMPIFLESDLKPLVIKMTGEFRWEMCKRVQGSRWNDLSDPSLTSLFSDYLQFYMNNRNLSMQTMLAIRNEISSARNNYKTVFVSNYADWLLHESRGAARLNGVAINVLMTFCPFTDSIREGLTTNLRYAEALNRYKAKQNKRVQALTRVIQRVRQNGKNPPQELLDELEFAKR